MSTIGTLAVKILANATGFVRGVEDAGSAADRFNKKIDRQLAPGIFDKISKAGGELKSSFTDSLEGAAGSVKGFGSALVALGPAGIAAGVALAATGAAAS